MGSSAAYAELGLEGWTYDRFEVGVGGAVQHGREGVGDRGAEHGGTAGPRHQFFLDALNLSTSFWCSSMFLANSVLSMPSVATK